MNQKLQMVNLATSISFLFFSFAFFFKSLLCVNIQYMLYDLDKKKHTKFKFNVGFLFMLFSPVIPLLTVETADSASEK